MIRALFARRLRLPLLGAALAASAAVFPFAASADPATDTAVRTFVTAIDASPDWAATFDGLATDSNGATVLTNLKVLSAVPGMSIAIDSLAVSKGTATSDGKYGAAKLTAGNVTISAGPLSVTLANVVMDDFAVPGGLAFAFDPAKPFTSMVHAYELLAKAHLGDAHAATLAVGETLGNTTSRATYSDVTLTRLDSGRITTLSAGPLVTQTPIPDKLNPNPLVTINVAHADAKDIDLAGLLHVFDPPPAQAGPRTFQPAIANVTYRDAAIQLAPRNVANGVTASVTIKLGTMSMDDFRVRPPTQNIANSIDKSITEPFVDEAQPGDPSGLVNLLSVYSVGKFTATPIDVTLTGIDTFHLDGLSVANLSLDGLGEFDLNGLMVAVKDMGSFQAGKIAVGGVAFPSADTLTSGIRTAQTGGDVDLSSLAPSIGFVEFDALDAEINGAPGTRLAKFRTDFANNVGNVPTSIKLDIEGADLDAALVPGFVGQQLSHLGYTRLVTDIAGQIVWNEAKKTTTISGLKLSIKNIGTVNVDAVLNGPTRDDIVGLGKLAGIQSFGDKLSLASGTLSFKDDSITGKVIADQANGLKIDPDKFRDQFAKGLPFMLLPVGSGDFQKKAGPVFQDFIRSPGTVTFTATPAMPIPLPTLINAARSSGIFNLPTLLNLSVTGVPGPAKPATTPAPAAPAPAPGPAAPAAPLGGDIRGTVQPPN